MKQKKSVYCSNIKDTMFLSAGEKSDEEIAKAVQEGNTELFGVLIRRFFSILCLWK